MRAATVAVWLATRGLCVWLLLEGPERVTNGDVRYFAVSFRAMAHHGLAGTLVEYPLPAVGVLLVPWALARVLGVVHGFRLLVVAMALITDAAFMVLLHRLGGRHRWSGLLVWLLGVPLLGATAFARFDLLPGVLVGATVLLASRHPKAAGTCVAVATAVKLWPALVVPGLVAVVRRRSALLLVVVLVGGTFAVASLVVAGWSRLVSPLTFESRRGLQIESLAATPVMVGRAVHPHWWRVFYSTHHAYEIVGPGVRWLVDASTVATSLFALLLLVTWVLVLHARDRLTVEGLVWLTLAAVTGFITVGKVLSPQYLLWVLPIGAAGLAVVEQGARRLLPWMVLALLATGLTQVVYPVDYHVLRHDTATPGVLWVLVGRNLLLGGLAAWAWVQTYREVRRARRGRA